MFVKIAGQTARTRCDACMKLEIQRPNIINIRGEQSRRPDEGSRDRYFELVLPPSVSTVTGKPDGRYKGCAREDMPGVLVPLHLCPACAIDIRKCLTFRINKVVFKDGPFDKKVMDAIQISHIGDVRILKPGMLRTHLLEVKSRNVFPVMGTT